MLQNTCSVCGEKFEDQYFNKEQTKCILHCEKDDLWENEEKYDLPFLDLFIEFINNGIFKKLGTNDNLRSNLKYAYLIDNGYTPLKYIVFPTDTSYFKICEIAGHTKLFFQECKFFETNFGNYSKFEDMTFIDCLFYTSDYKNGNYRESDYLHFYNMKINSLIYSGLNAKPIHISVLDSHLKILSLGNSVSTITKTTIDNFLMSIHLSTKEETSSELICEECFINEMKIDDNIINIKDSTIANALVLDNRKITSLNIQNSTLKNGLNLNNTMIKDRLSLINSRIETKKLDLSNTSLPTSTNFLNAQLEVENRETARIIKNSFEQQNNIIEANKYYALEMKHYEHELSWKSNFKEKLIFTCHDLSSEHSQNWVLPLFLILLLSIIYGTCEYLLGADFKKYPLYANILSFLFIVLSIPFIINNVVENKNIKHILSAFIFLSFGIYFYITKDVSLELLAKAINPFSSMKSNESINGIQLVFKIVIAYLIYQFITSVRQNTRRK